MITQWEPVLKDVISKVLETMFFAMVDFEECGSEDRPFDYESEIHLLNHKGEITILMRMSKEFATMITANFLGIDENQVEAEDLEDSVRELMNMVGGGYHANIKNMEWQLGIPMVQKIGPDGTKGVLSGTGVCFGCFGEPAGLAVLDYLPS